MPQYERSVRLARDAGTKLEQSIELLVKTRKNLAWGEHLRSILPPEDTDAFSTEFISLRDAAIGCFAAGRFQESLNKLNDYAQAVQLRTKELEHAADDNYERFLRQIEGLAEQPAYDCASAAVRSIIRGETAPKENGNPPNGPKLPWLPLLEPTRRSFVNPVILVRSLSDPEEAGRRYAALWNFMREMAEKWSSVSDLDVKDDPVFDEHRHRAIEATERLLDGGNDPEGEDGSIIRDAVVWCHEQSNNRKDCFSKKKEAGMRCGERPKKRLVVIRIPTPFDAQYEQPKRPRNISVTGTTPRPAMNSDAPYPMRSNW